MTTAHPCLLPLLALLLSTCQPRSTQKPLLSRVRPDESGLAFVNKIQPFEGEQLNATTYDPLYNGAGVGIGDFDRDGRPDVFFAGNMVSSRLYLNRTAPGTADLRFTDVTQAAGLTTRVWCTGVSVADVNADGWPDVYVCVAGPDTTGADRANRLFINQQAAPGQVPTFREMAREYGLAEVGMNSQAAFFDYDHDGDLDCYILKNAAERTGRNAIRPKRTDGSGPSTDKLYRNDGPIPGPPLRHSPVQFTDVSRQEGITIEGYGLGLTIADINQDGWLDIYCANDFLSNDLLWINQHNRAGRHTGFRNETATYFKHTSYNSMGVDIQDVNNDQRPDVMVVDMLPETDERQKMMLIKTNWDFFHLARQQGYQDEYVRNTLQVNMGSRQEKDTETGPTSPAPFFSEAGQMAGVFRTDWSWSPLMQDFDNDGRKDLLITNGYRRDITNLDYVVYLNRQVAGFGARGASREKPSLDALYKLPEIKLHNYAYQNITPPTTGNAANPPLFADKSEVWGMGEQIGRAHV